MKHYLIFVIVFKCIISFGQNEKINYHCNDKWLDELIKTDSISKENRKMDYMCYVSIFDSMEINKKYKMKQYYRAIALLKNDCDGAYAEAFFVRAFEHVFKNPNYFMKNLKNSESFIVKNWAYMLWNEYGIRSPEEGNYGKNLIRELEPLLNNKNQLEWIALQNELLMLDKK